MASAPEVVDVAASGDWLFKQGDMLLGPVPAKVLVDKLYRGEIDGRTPVAREGTEEFVPIEQIAFFKVHAKKAQVKVKVEHDTQTQLRVQKKQSQLKLGAFAGAGLVLVLGASYGAYWLAVNKPWRTVNADDLVTITVEAPTIGLAALRGDEVAVAIPENPTGPSAPGVPSTHHPARPARHSGPTPGAGPHTGQSDADGLASHQQFDSSAIAAIAQQKASTIYPCIKAEAVAHPPTEQVSLPLEFTVNNDGHVGKLWSDNHDFGEGTTLYNCVLKTMKSWSFPHYEGEEANVKLKFAWGPKH